MLSDRDIRAEIAAGRLGIDPLDESRIQPASVDVTLLGEFRAYPAHRHSVISLRNAGGVPTELVHVAPGETFILRPGQFVLGSTAETLSLPPSLAATVEGTSTNGRCGLVVHSTAGFIDPGFYGMVTLELSNVNTLPVELTPGDVIGQLCFFRLATPAAAPYHGRYQGQHGPWAPRSVKGKGGAPVP